jgi:hypothetical protein
MASSGNKKQRSNSDKNHFKSYKANGIFTKNKKAKLERHLKNHPDDVQAKEASKNIPSYRRKAPKQKIWTPETRYLASLFKKAGNKGSDALFDPRYDE